MYFSSHNRQVDRFQGQQLESIYPLTNRQSANADSGSTWPRQPSLYSPTEADGEAARQSDNEPRSRHFFLKQGSLWRTRRVCKCRPYEMRREAKSLDDERLKNRRGLASVRADPGAGTKLW